MSLAPMRGLSLDQAPPLSVVASFFVAGPLFVLAAGLLLMLRGGDALSQPLSPLTLALTHLVTLGFLGSVMLGAVYQMTPVVLGAPVPWMRAAHVVHAAFSVGVACLVVGLALPEPHFVRAAIWLVGPALVLFLLPVSVGMRRAPARSETSRGMRFAVFSLFLVATLGLWMAHGHAGMGFPGDRLRFIDAHVSLGFFGWVASLLVAVSWQVLPMFYLAAEPRDGLRKLTRWLLVLGALTPTVGLLGLRLFGERGLDAVFEVMLHDGSAPGVVGAFLLHPWLTLRSIRARKRKRRDASLRFWQVAMTLGPLVAVAAVWAASSTDPRARLAYGVLALWGWAGLVMHGMLGRVVPFLVWFHRFAPLAGIEPIPSMKSLLPDAQAELGLRLHVGSLAVVLAGVLSSNDLALRTGGGLVALTAVVLLNNLLRALNRRPSA